MNYPELRAHIFRVNQEQLERAERQRTRPLDPVINWGECRGDEYCRCRTCKPFRESFRERLLPPGTGIALVIAAVLLFWAAAARFFVL